MFKSGDVCVVNDNVMQSSSGLYRTLLGKQVTITSSDTVNEKYPIRVLNPDDSQPFQWSSQLQMKGDYLTKEI